MRVYWVSRRLAFGSAIRTWKNVEHLKQIGVTHIVNLRFSQNSQKVKQFKWLWLPFHDDFKPRPRWFYKRAWKFYKKALREDRTKVFVMCHHGKCRSASLTYFYLRARGKSPDVAKSITLRARPNAVVVRAYRESAEEYL